MNATSNPLPLQGLYELSVSEFCDNRGTFRNLYRFQNSNFYEAWGERKVSQINLSLTKKRGTIRGLHTQLNPYADAKIVICVRGCVWDVVVDLNLDSPTYQQWHALELSPVQGNALFVPENFAHGFQALEPCSEILYIHSSEWKPDYESGIRYDDPYLNIHWPLNPVCISSRDLVLPHLN